ncbi:hypothetical protein [Pseudofrankia sp. BMG5.37]|uniref:hypothetical protein n=1 Tax=Pseudofrankia sp. BMG5.37 TaxID=3050035 RepID=UPI0028955A19|nr:hypothetical protein [Pseudofrankia sp. BMG5.37]MDT3445850.1 hypothetical protein [Pseudofrankia sp. BMG5.37]
MDRILQGLFSRTACRPLCTDGLLGDERLVMAATWEGWGVGPDDRKKLFDQARELARREVSLPRAERLWTEVVDAYRHAVVDAKVPDPEDERQLARALWRHAMVLHALGRPATGLRPGHEAVALFERLENAVSATYPRATALRDHALAELVTALADVGEIAFAAAQPRARLRLLERAISTGLDRAGPALTAGRRVRRALGSAYHNQAVALLDRHLKNATPHGDALAAVSAASQATELRQGLRDDDDPQTNWELANSYGVYALCLIAAADLRRASMVIRPGNRLVAALGPDAQEPRQRLEAAAALLAAANTRSRGRWRPSRRG